MHIGVCVQQDVSARNFERKVETKICQHCDFLILPLHTCLKQSECVRIILN